MTAEELQSHSKLIDKSVTWIGKKADDVWQRYEEIDECGTEECEKERVLLREELDHYLDKLEGEEKMIDQYEEILHNKTGIR